MIRHKRLEHRFVDHIPERLGTGVLYVSMEYATSAHSCCCGCGEEVVTPFTPTDWKMTFDGETISLYPSIGNWTLPCRSHYVIDRGKVVEAGPWSDEQVDAERRRDRAAKAHFYGQPPMAESPAQPVPPKVAPGFWQRLWNRISSRF
ncbi:hypothetical protein EN943_17980 [Mesorhizobium sp. M7A.F.Ca.US.006.01.1.1]|uniref:DUF6527 family protein n=1 Tax=Mesorhizobium sp. M7A.F.Ca.US.006.01.1.1 TaxID=2496707 RepID=UPI000FCCC05B|nr:DUF6527 family protein [Mesorhizobium sp. M7A.F.Ca.US.006.01.1.1]RUZ76249.1 hypothetical protein EN943_17980 [Mesorhizobium sp. M7A.F.Ca.US.006.01.1.1]